MNQEMVESICITVCVVSVTIVIGLWLYWLLVTQRQLDVEIIKAMGAEQYAAMRQCLTYQALCQR